MSEATIEVDGEVYALTNSTMHDNTQIYTAAGGERYALRLGAQSLDAKTSNPRARALVHKGAVRCRVELYGATYTGYVELVRWSAGFASIDLRVHDIKPIPAAPSLDELTDPADLDWGTIRSTCAARDWRAAWGVVGTDHTGDATPGEVYLLAVARRASATAAALKGWRESALRLPTLMLESVAVASEQETRNVRKMMARKINEDAGWQRIKRIAAWESSARAQYDERGVPYAATRRWSEQRGVTFDGVVDSFQQEYQGIPAPDDTLARTLHALYGAAPTAPSK